MVVACGGERRSGLRRGDPFPAFVLGDLEGRPHAFPDALGRVWLINLWATWCEPCRREMPALDRLRAEYGSRLGVLAISVDEDINLVREFVLRYRLGLTVLRDPNQQATRHLLPGLALPRSYLVARDGRVAEVVEGYHDWEAPAARAVLEHLLAG